MKEKNSVNLKRNKLILKISIFILFILFLGIATLKIYSSIREFKEDFKSLNLREELIGETVCSDGKYKIEAYSVNGGLTVDWSVRCYLIEDGERREIYRDYHVKEANMHWIDCDTISINNHEIDLPKGKYDFREE